MPYSKAKSWFSGECWISKSLNRYTRSPQDSFVGLTPGILVCFGLLHWLGGVFSRRDGIAKGKKPGHMVRVLRSVVNRAVRAAAGMLTFAETLIGY